MVQVAYYQAVMPEKAALEWRLTAQVQHFQSLMTPIALETALNAKTPRGKDAKHRETERCQNGVSEAVVRIDEFRRPAGGR